MALLRSLLVKLEADTAKFSSDMAKARGTIEGMQKSINLIRSAAIVELGVRAFQAARQIDQFAMSIASSLNDIGRMAEISGMAVDEFQKWKFAAKMADVEVEALAIGIRTLSKNMAEGDKAFVAMGVNIKDAATGSLRPLSDVMKDVMDKFRGYEDGAGKVALATDLFGRSGEALIPLLNKGSEGFRELAVEAQKLGIILDPGLVAAGSAAEDKLKKMNMQLEAQKLRLLPLAEAWIDFKGMFIAWGAWFSDNVLVPLDKLDKLMDKIIYKWTGTFFEEGRQHAERLPNIEESRYMAAFGAGAKEKVPERGTAKAGKAEEVRIQGLTPKEWGEYADAVIDENDALAKKLADIQAERTKAEEAENKRFQEMDESGWVAYIDFLEDERFQYYTKMGELQTQKNNESLELDRKMFEEDVAYWTAFAEEKLRLLEKLNQIEIDKNKEYWSETSETKRWKEKLSPLLMFTGQLETTWSNVFAGMADSTKSFTDVVRDAFTSLANSVVQQIMRMIFQWMVWQAVSGIAGGGASGAGIATNLLGYSNPLKWLGLSEGGIVTRPTMALVGERGPEAIIPLDKAEGGTGDTYVFIAANDAKSFEDMLKRNRGSLKSVIKDINRTSPGGYA